MQQDAERLRDCFAQAIGIPFLEGNAVRKLVNGAQIFPALEQAIAASRETIDFVTFVYWPGDWANRLARALAERAAAGVDVRIVLDSFGAASIAAADLEALEQSGCRVQWYRPIRRLRPWRYVHRTHRKILICDRKIAFTGGVGIAAEWEGDAADPSQWRDSHFALTGPAIAGLEAAFLDNWIETTGRAAGELPAPRQHPETGDAIVQVVRAAGRPGRNDCSRLMQAAIESARSRLRIASAYFVPDDAMIELLTRAARRGVDVEILVPGPHTDSRISQLAGQSRYSALLAAGVRIHRFQPTMMHLKVAIVDDVCSIIGSANFNQRSMRQDDEVVATVIDAALAASLNADFDHDRDRSRLVDGAAHAQRPWTERCAEKLADWVRFLV